MNLKEYWGKDVKIIYTDGDIIVGHAEGFTDKLNCPEELDNLTIATNDGRLNAVFEDEIQSIEILE
ncbi:MAG: hypothetical protein HXL16_05975 [Peptostreptococcaceae bacterium]|jgi:hypothetical protein|nr:hypothetical protein [Peptostreptococcaceae bacterium]